MSAKLKKDLIGLAFVLLLLTLIGAAYLWDNTIARIVCILIIIATLILACAFEEDYDKMA